jgi:protein CpxP
MRRHLGKARTVVLLLAGGMAWAQQPPGPGPGMEPRPPMPRRPPMERALRGGPHGRWWNNPEMAQKLGLTPEQQKKIDEVFQESRLKLIDLNASLQKEEVILEPLVGADQPDESKILPQIDRVAQARAELEKANARMLLGIRRVLTPEQWKKLRAEERSRPGMGPGHRPHHPEMRDGDR